MKTKNRAIALILTISNDERTHQGKMCCGRTTIKTFVDAKPIWKRKIDQLNAELVSQSIGV